jgi:hypothetical protein
LLQRHADWFSLLKVSPAKREAARQVMERTLDISQGMMHLVDIDSLAAAVLHCKPKRVFEIGTYRGASSEMILQLLPEVQVISIAFVNDEPGRKFNNDELSLADVGALVSAGNRDRPGLHSCRHAG